MRPKLLRTFDEGIVSRAQPNIAHQCDAQVIHQRAEIAMLPPPVSVEIGSQRIDATTSIVTPNSRLTGSNCAFLNNTMSVKSTSMMRIMFSSVSSIPSAGIALMQPGLIRIKKQTK